MRCDINNPDRYYELLNWGTEGLFLQCCTTNTRALQQ